MKSLDASRGADRHRGRNERGHDYPGRRDYLTGNITVAAGDVITIATSGVKLDLMGFTISSTASPAAGSGIVINSLL